MCVFPGVQALLQLLLGTYRTSGTFTSRMSVACYYIVCASEAASEALCAFRSSSHGWMV